MAAAEAYSRMMFESKCLNQSCKNVWINPVKMFESMLWKTLKLAPNIAERTLTDKLKPMNWFLKTGEKKPYMYAV